MHHDQSLQRHGEDDRQRRERLPPSVYALALRLGANPEVNRQGVYLEQLGRMKPLGATSWISFTAKQTISLHNCEFDWRARTGPFGIISARDALTEGEGRFDVMALGLIPISRAEHSSPLMRGELMRYLAELPWAPDAILLNSALRWREDGPDRLAVSAGSGATAAEVTLSLDGEGRIAGAFAPDRPRSATAPISPTPWRGRFSDYRHHEHNVAPLRRRGRLGNRREGGPLLAGPHRALGGAHRLRLRRSRARAQALSPLWTGPLGYLSSGPS